MRNQRILRRHVCHCLSTLAEEPSTPTAQAEELPVPQSMEAEGSPATLPRSEHWTETDTTASVSWLKISQRLHWLHLLASVRLVSGTLGRYDMNRLIRWDIHGCLNMFSNFVNYVQYIWYNISIYNYIYICMYISLSLSLSPHYIIRESDIGKLLGLSRLHGLNRPAE